MSSTLNDIFAQKVIMDLEMQYPGVGEVRVAVNTFMRDYIPALLYFISPAKVAGMSVQYRPDGMYSDDELGLPGDFFIVHQQDKRYKNNRGKKCNLGRVGTNFS